MEAFLAKEDMAVKEVEEKARKIELDKKELDKQVGIQFTFTPQRIAKMKRNSLKSVFMLDHTCRVIVMSTLRGQSYKRVCCIFL